MKIGYEAKRVFHNRTGLGNYGRDLVRAVSSQYPENAYYLYNPKAAKDTLFQPNGVNVIERLPETWLNRFVNPLWRQLMVVNDLRRDGVDLFHGLSGELPVGLCRSGIPSVVTIHDLIFARFPQWYKPVDREIYFQKFRYAARHADRVIAISRQTKADVVSFLGVPEDRVEVIYQGCHPAFKRRYTDEELQSVRLKYNLPTDFILNVGTIESRKNVLSAVKAIRQLDTHLVIAGRPTPYLQEVKAYIDQHGIAAKVSFVHGASLDELARLYQAALFFVYPSFFEGFGIPIIEALYSGTPVITSDSGCFPEAGGPASLYVDPHDVDALSAAILRLASDSALRDTMRMAGLAYSTQFDDEVWCRQLMTCYRSV